MKKIKAPEWHISQWFNTNEQISLEKLRGKVVVVHAFQMLCPGCVSVALPQTEKIHQLFDQGHVAVIGIHTVFEHHEAMTPISLEAFIYEYRLTFPIGVDIPSGTGPVPKTMAAYNMQGTPTLILIDQEGYIRKQKFGHTDDMLLGAEITALIHSNKIIGSSEKTAPENKDDTCSAEKCST